ncbi:hypothetical protein TWF694_002623 [Orbilia ellipsospora]|uniref:WSC domain-containing protein n=1 Tax=Orbilia ellipsospora TaxID=2528407 RepID=A0AAV9X3U8_9PEZI
MPTSPTSRSDSVWRPTTSITRHRRIARPMGLRRAAWLPLLVGSVLLTDVVSANIDLIYCSKQNTAGDYPVFNSIYQSDGKCHDHCVADYAFAIVLWQNCWCSNYAPTDTQPLGDCTDACPGFPNDTCGNRKENYYNYIELDRLPSSQTNLPSSTSPPPSAQTATNPPTTNKPGTPIVSVVTILGTQSTVTITPTSTGNGADSFPVNAEKSNDFFSDAGRVAGVFVAIGALVIAIIALVFFLRKRRNDRRKSVDSSNHPEMGMSGPGSPTMGTTGSSSPNTRPRSTSTLGFVGGLNDKTPAITTTGFTETERVTDQRLDPNQIWMRFDNDNGSRVSLRSLQDNQDYSRRVLKLANPDR